ncbi:hypothetical protein [Streptomyces sp. NPDC058872]|uniref:hypothetical protein n=1 Tax=Streptomyces sp. NPDC058872 TaxID=3346661 RepID=UPI0036C846BC
MPPRPREPDDEEAAADNVRLPGPGTSLARTVQGQRDKQPHFLRATDAEASYHHAGGLRDNGTGSRRGQGVSDRDGELLQEAFGPRRSPTWPT